MSTLVFHTMVAPHVQQAALAFHEAGKLKRFITSVCDNPESLRQRAITRTGKLLGLDLAREFRRRAVTSLPRELVEVHPWAELFRIAVARMDKDKRLSDLVWEQTEHRFDRMVSRRLSKHITTVYGFENLSLRTFQRARELDLQIAYEMPAPETRLVRQITTDEIGKFPELKTAYFEHLQSNDARRLTRREEEWRLADIVIVSSKFTKRTYEQAGFDVAKVRVVPLGAPPIVDLSADTVIRTQENSPLKLIWAGSFSLLKGAHYLLEAWRKGNLGQHAHLKVFGTVSLPARVLQPIPKGIEFCGSVPRAELMDAYQQSDILVFPTLCDGFGMVVTEAWSRGLPVITTNRAGASELLRHNENGLLIPPQDAEAIQQSITWCLTHRAELHVMRQHAVKTAAQWQWSDYRNALRGAVYSPTEAGHAKQV